MGAAQKKIIKKPRGGTERFRPFQCVDRGQRFLFGKFSRSHYVASIVEAMKKLSIIRKLRLRKPWFLFLDFLSGITSDIPNKKAIH